MNMSFSNIWGLVLGLITYAAAYPMIDAAIKTITQYTGPVVDLMLKVLPALLLVIIISSSFEEENINDPI